MLVLSRIFSHWNNFLEYCAIHKIILHFDSLRTLKKTSVIIISVGLEVCPTFLMKKFLFASFEYILRSCKRIRVYAIGVRYKI